MEIEEMKDDMINAKMKGMKYASVNASVNSSHRIDVSLEFQEDDWIGRVPIQFIFSSERRIKKFHELISTALEIARNVNQIESKSVDCIKDAHVYGADYELISHFMIAILVESANKIESYAQAMCNMMLERDDQYEICEIASVESGSIELHAAESFREIVREHLKLKKSI